MRVVVTGGAGHIGQYVALELRAHGHVVVSADQRLPEWGGPAKLLDLRNLGETYGALRGADAVLHLAGIPYSGVQPNEVVFGNNVLSAYNVFEAAAGLGIAKVVQASSFCVLGFSRWVKPFAPTYAPIDEAHPNAPQECYGLSKLVAEDIARMYVVAHGVQVVSLRFCPVVFPELSIANCESRLRRYWTKPADGAEKLWSYVDVRDAATACRLAIEAPDVKCEALYISAADTHQREPTRDLLARYFPYCRTIADDFARDDPCESLVSGRRAREILGFVPAHRWGMHVSPDSLGFADSQGPANAEGRH